MLPNEGMDEGIILKKSISGVSNLLGDSKKVKVGYEIEGPRPLYSLPRPLHSFNNNGSYIIGEDDKLIPVCSNKYDNDKARDDSEYEFVDEIVGCKYVCEETVTPKRGSEQGRGRGRGRGRGWGRGRGRGRGRRRLKRLQSSQNNDSIGREIFVKQTIGRHKECWEKTVMPSSISADPVEGKDNSSTTHQLKRRKRDPVTNINETITNPEDGEKIIVRAKRKHLRRGSIWVLSDEPDDESESQFGSASSNSGKELEDNYDTSETLNTQDDDDESESQFGSASSNSGKELGDNYDTSETLNTQDDEETVDSEFEAQQAEYDKEVNCKHENGVLLSGHDPSDDSQDTGIGLPVEKVDEFQSDNGSEESSKPDYGRISSTYSDDSCFKGKKGRKVIATLMMIMAQQNLCQVIV